MKQTLRQELRQKLIPTLELRQMLKLLQQTILELREEINQQLLQNPTLEEVTEEEEVNPPPDRIEAGKREDLTPERRGDDLDTFDWGSYYENLSSDPGPAYFPREKVPDDDAPFYENILTRRVSLREHLLWQLNLSNFTREEIRAGRMLIENIDTDGYLRIETGEVALRLGLPPEFVEGVLKKVQKFDPIGIGARDLKECLIIQMEEIAKDDALVREIIENHLPLMEIKNYDQIAVRTGNPLKEVIRAAAVIKGMEPKPGREYFDEEPHYIVPDVIVKKMGKDFIIQLNEDNLPKIRLSPYYRRLIGHYCEKRGIRLKRWEQVLDEEESSDDKSGNPGGCSSRDMRYIRKKLKEAEWFSKCIDRRRRTLLKVMDSILKYQMEFFEKGVPYLKPMVLQDIADDVEMHQSTISRVTSNKYVQTPHGLLPMKFFFNTGLSMDGQKIGSTSIKNTIKEMISREDPANPLSDRDIMENLKKRGIFLARRTIVKYRQEMGIISAKRRKRILD